MHTNLTDFISDFRVSFMPPSPYRGKSGRVWYISKVWSDYFKGWLDARYQTQFEKPVPVRRRLDAALWCPNATKDKDQIDIAIEWEWDNNKVEKQFYNGDFQKLFEVGAKCGLAVVQTHKHSKSGMTQAERIITNLRGSLRSFRSAKESIAVIEISRVFCTQKRIDFVCTVHDLDLSSVEEIARWSFSEL